ncbi:CDP-alcohol phosphatidyltransferase family protein [Labrys wisconsinensis]|uniref:CDP-diacylglycerol--serine O-phosphatidyltransferase n=1 Tax=Labrys wisconsinensis TaxID=425677 RepID=A0ABU0J9W4_9HYPH|nr:CDP-alcohol phosphatidyltransferase family protein [Labrys wisconsinensis]MDQ0471048.1 CDP-diacylglycerol--serine O-phosphatidyltransferase [Labrys wisconsinensis]
MVRYLADPANAITAAGLLFSALGLHFALSGHLELAVATVLWAMLCDHLDGVVAVRTRNRAADTARIGKSLDGLADLLYGAIFPAIVVMQEGRQGLLASIAGAALVLAGALRLSYFSNFGLSSDGRFTGVPLSYDVPVLAVLFLVRGWLPADLFPPVLSLVFLALAILHVSSIRVPALSGAMYGVVTVFSVLASGALAIQGWA